MTGLTQISDAVGAGYRVVGRLVGANGGPSDLLIVRPDVAMVDPTPADPYLDPPVPDQIGGAGPAANGLTEAAASIVVGPGYRNTVVDLEPPQVLGAAATEYAMRTMVDAQSADQIGIYVRTSLNQAVAIQAVGADFNAAGNLSAIVNVGSSQTLAAGSAAMQLLAVVFNFFANSEWHPYVGITVTTGGTAPTSGVLVAEARVRESVMRRQ